LLSKATRQINVAPQRLWSTAHLPTLRDFGYKIPWSDGRARIQGTPWSFQLIARGCQGIFLALFRLYFVFQSLTAIITYWQWSGCRASISLRPQMLARYSTVTYHHALDYCITFIELSKHACRYQHYCTVNESVQSTCNSRFLAEAADSRAESVRVRITVQYRRKKRAICFPS
jgi:hypothetical protein